MAATTTLRVRTDTRDRVNRLAREAQVSPGEMVDRWARKEEQDRLLTAMNSDFEQLRQDEAAWAEFKADTAEWDTTSADTGARA